MNIKYDLKDINIDDINLAHEFGECVLTGEEIISEDIVRYYGDNKSVISIIEPMSYNMDSKLRDDIMFNKIVDINRAALTSKYDEIVELESKVKEEKITYKDILSEEFMKYCVNVSKIGDVEDIINEMEEVQKEEIVSLINFIEFDYGFELLLLDKLSFYSSNLNKSTKIFNDLKEYIKFTVKRELILENLQIVKQEMDIYKKYKYYEDINDLKEVVENVIKEVDSFTVMRAKKHIFDIIDKYEDSLTYLITEVDLIYGIFILLTFKHDVDNGFKSDRSYRKCMDNNIDIESDMIRVNKEIRDYNMPRSKGSFYKIINTLNEYLKLYFDIEEKVTVKNQLINYDLNRYLVVKNFKGIQWFYLLNYKDETIINSYLNVKDNISKDYYDFFLRENIVKTIGENTKLDELNVVIKVAVNNIKEYLKKTIIQKTDICKKVKLIRYLNENEAEEVKIDNFTSMPKFLSEDVCDEHKIESIFKFIKSNL